MRHVDQKLDVLLRILGSNVASATPVDRCVITRGMRGRASKGEGQGEGEGGEKEGGNHCQLACRERCCGLLHLFVIKTRG